MATYHIDFDGGSDITGDGSVEAPYRKAPSQAGAAVPNALGNVYRLKRGTTTSEPIDSTFVGSAANEGQRVTYEAYGDADSPPVIDVAGASAYCIRIQNKDRVSITDIDVRNATNTGLQILNNTTRACSYILATRVRAYSCAFDGVSMTHPVTAAGPSPSAAVGVIFDGCEGYNNGQHGVAIVAYATGAILRNCYGQGNSLTSSGWGVYHGGFAYTYNGTAGWTIAGNVKSRTIDTGAKPYGVVSGNTVAGTYFLAENVGTPTTPGTGEWGWSGSTLYVNIGVIASGYAIAVIFQPNTNCVIEDSSGDDHLLFDGVGVGVDRGVYGARILRSRGTGNAGSAVQVNLATGVTVDGVISSGNRESVYMSSVGGTCLVKHVTSDDLTYGLRAERLFTGDTLTLRNNATSAPTAIYAATISGTLSADYNGYTGALSGVSAGGNDTADLLGVGQHLGYTTDIYGNARFNPPTIGAYEPPRARSAASARNPRV